MRSIEYTELLHLNLSLYICRGGFNNGRTRMAYGNVCKNKITNSQKERKMLRMNFAKMFSTNPINIVIPIAHNPPAKV
jgi:hypothetical protein